MAAEPAYMVTPAGSVFVFVHSVPYEVESDEKFRSLAPGYYDDLFNPVEPGDQVPADIDDYDDL